MTVHLVVPDLQCKPGVPTDHLRWIGRFILEKKPDVVIDLGDTHDMESLSSWDRGKFQFEGRRYREDIQAGNTGIRLLDEPTVDANRKRRVQYNPRKVRLRGNHEYRIQRYLDEHPEFIGLIGYHDINNRDWEVHEFLEVVEIDGVSYSHFFANPMTGKPYGGQAHTRLKTVGTSFTMGHQQTLDTAIRYLPSGRQQRALIAGACYLHDEDYKGQQGNAHWRGVLLCHNVHDGEYDITEVSLDYLCRRYEGVSVGEFLRGKYPDQTGTLWRVP